MGSAQSTVQKGARPESARARILQGAGLLSLAICLVGLLALAASAMTAVGTRVHYVAGLAPLVSLIVASGTLIAGRVMRVGCRLKAARVALWLDLAFYAVAFLVVMKWLQNIDG